MLIISGFFYDLIRILVKELCDKNVIIFVVGVGDDYDEDEFWEISGDDGWLVYRMMFDGLENLKMELKRKICLCKYFNRVDWDLYGYYRDYNNFMLYIY